MSFIAVNLKVIEGLAASTARSAGVDEDRILAGLVRLWHRCWSDGVDHFDRTVLAGILGAANLDLVLAALEAFGFLESVDDLWRVRGAERYLRLKAARQEGGRKASAARKLKQAEITQNGSSRATPEAALELVSAAAQSSSLTEHRAPSTEKKIVADKPPPDDLQLFEPPVVPTPPKAPKERKASVHEAWWAKAQAQAAKLKPDRVGERLQASDLNVVLKPIRDEVGEVGLDRAWSAFLANAYARERGWPLKLFAAQWRQHHNVAPKLPAVDHPQAAKVY